jgi:hypothetical protein
MAVTHDEQGPLAPAIPGHPLEPPLSVPEAVGAGIVLAGEVPSALTDVRDATPWAAPEVLDGRSRGSVASDVYSLGAVVWHLLVGHPPFWVADGDNSPRALTARTLHSAPPRTQRDDVPPSLDTLLARCLSKTPEDRPESALARARALQEIEVEAGCPRTPIAVRGDETYVVPVRAEPGPVPDDVAPHAAPEPRERPASTWRSPALWWSIGGVVLLVLVAVGVKVLADAPAATAPSPPGFGATRSSGAAGAVPRPIVTAKRLGTSVEFRWRAADVPRAGDSFQWRFASRGGTHLTTGPSVTVRSPARVCVQVRLARAGLPPSPYASACG